VGGVGGVTTGGSGVLYGTCVLASPYSATVFTSVDGADVGTMPQTSPRFQVHVHPETPVSIVCAVSGDVVSPHVQTQFQLQVEGNGEELSELVVGGGAGADAAAAGAARAAVADAV
jgi:hypothetical protein